MSNALDVITLEQLEKLKKLGLVVVHSKPTKSMFAACLAKKISLKLEYYDSLGWDESYNAMIGASINQQASEVDWSKYESPKIKTRVFELRTDGLTKILKEQDEAYIKVIEEYLKTLQLNLQLNYRNIK